MDKNINDKLDYFLIGEKVTNYQIPLIVEKITKFNGILTMYTRNIKGKQLAFEEDSLITAINNYNRNNNEETTTKTEN